MNLFGVGFVLALLKFLQVYQLPLDAQQFGGVRAMQQTPVELGTRSRLKIETGIFKKWSCLTYNRELVSTLREN